MKDDFEMWQDKLERVDLLELSSNTRSEFATSYWKEKSSLTRHMDTFMKSHIAYTNLTTLPAYQEPCSSFGLANVEKGSSEALRGLNDKINSHLRALSTMSTISQLADGLLIHIISSKLDRNTQERWEEALPCDKLPSWSDMTTFLERRCRLLENLAFRP
ncbi:uncharacterized protein LOC127011771 isoform X2 [Drosophila biarmipes]|uniref:uncharacterized protein LOC127011771 isoform X2 n=1 Tax=Drosophila biarmipes TaxID=125945 RepID=UPI0021CCB9D9|nr:uncharacterized protein LOC127011771 isoform X2 [Drosophila biarmipes]